MAVDLEVLAAQAEKATPDQIQTVIDNNFADDPAAQALLSKILAERTDTTPAATPVTNIVDSFVDKNVSGLIPDPSKTSTDVNVPIESTIESVAKTNVPVATPTALTPDQVQQMIDAQATTKAGQTQAEFNTILEYIRSGSTVQKEQIAAQMRNSLETNLARIREEGIETGAAFDAAKREVRSQGALAGRQLKERLAAIGITGAQTEKFFQQKAGQEAQAIGGLAIEESKSIAKRNRLVNDIKSASESELASLLAGVDANEMAAIVAQLNADREFELKSDFQKQQMISSQLENQLLSMQLEAFPAKLAAELKSLNQDLEMGKLTIEEAKYQMDQLQDPESIYNQLQDFEVRMSELDLANADLDTKLKVKELNKKVAALSKVYTDPNEALKAEVEAKRLLVELNELDKILTGDEPEGASTEDVRSFLLSMSNQGWESLQVAIEENRELLIQYDLLTYANSLLAAARRGATEQ